MKFQSADDLHRSKASAALLILKLRQRRPGRRSTGRIRRSEGCGHLFQHSTKIAVRRNYRGGGFIERGAHYVEAAKKRIEFLRIGRTKRCRVNRRRFGVG